jgi:hypothetical protein
MNTDEALNFLGNHQPMPGDGEISQEECDLFIAVLNHFKENPDERCIPLFIYSVSINTGLGMYEIIGDVLVAQNRDQVVEKLKDALIDGNDAIRYRCCWWAADLDAWELEEQIDPLTNSSNEDLREAAGYFLKLRNENV